MPWPPDPPKDKIGEEPVLTQAFRYIFTSPSSAEFTSDDLDSEFLLAQPKRHRCCEQRTCSNVASLHGMKTVAPRAITYIAVQVSIFFCSSRPLPLIPICQLHFALASCGSWHIIDVFFDYHQFYKNIITFFEDIADTEAEEFIKELVLWWNWLVTMKFVTEKTNSTLQASVWPSKHDQLHPPSRWQHVGGSLIQETPDSQYQQQRFHPTPLVMIVIVWLGLSSPACTTSSYHLKWKIDIVPFVHCPQIGCVWYQYGWWWTLVTLGKLE